MSDTKQQPIVDAIIKEGQTADPRRTLLIDTLVETRLRWYEQDGAAYETLEDMIRFGYIGCDQYTTAELESELTELVDGEHDPDERKHLCDVLGISDEETAA